MDQRKKKRRKQLILAAAVVLLVAGVLLLRGVLLRPAPAGMVLTNTTTPVVGATAGVSATRSFCDQGFFQLSRTDQLLRFFEYDTKTSYIMCGESSCSHSSADCPAWNDLSNPVQGLAAYQGTIYALIWSEARGAYEMCSMQLDGTDRTALAALPPLSVTLSNGAGTRSNIQDVVYSGGHAWITVSEPREVDPDAEMAWQQLWSFNRFYGVDLSSGRIFEVKLPGDDTYGNRVSLEYATDDQIIFCGTAREPILSEEAFLEARERGEYADITTSEQVPDLYDAYRFEWEKKPAVYTYYSYDIASGEITALESGTCLHESLDPHMFLGEYDGMFFVEDHSDDAKTIESDSLYEWDKQNRNFLWDLETGEQRDLFKSTVIMTSQRGVMTSHITTEGLIFYRVYLENKQNDIYAYSLETGESQLLYSYNFDDGVPFEIYSETPEAFIGCYKDKLCSIAKEDYMTGAFEKSKILGML